MPFAEVKRKITGYMKWKKDTKKEVQNDVNQENTWFINHLIHFETGPVYLVQKLPYSTLEFISYLIQEKDVLKIF